MKGPSSQTGEGAFSLSKNAVIVSSQWACGSGLIRRVESSANESFHMFVSIFYHKSSFYATPFSKILVFPSANYH